MALAAKAQGFEVYASDRARRGAIVAAALIANSSVRLREADWLPALRADDLRANGAAAVSVFTAAQARRIDGLLTAAAARQAPTRALLELLAIKLVCRLFPMSLPNATDAARAAAGEYDTISPRRLGHYLRRDRWIQPAGLRTLATAINGGVIGGRGHATQRDARETIAASPAAVIYLDPPTPAPPATAPTASSTRCWETIFPPPQRRASPISRMPPSRPQSSSSRTAGRASP